jgi:hypothetical protein
VADLDLHHELTTAAATAGVLWAAP